MNSNTGMQENPDVPQEVGTDGISLYTSKSSSEIGLRDRLEQEAIQFNLTRVDLIRTVVEYALLNQELFSEYHLREPIKSGARQGMGTTVPRVLSRRFKDWAARLSRTPSQHLVKVLKIYFELKDKFGLNIFNRIKENKKDCKADCLELIDRVKKLIKLDKMVKALEELSQVCLGFDTDIYLMHNKFYRLKKQGVNGIKSMDRIESEHEVLVKRTLELAAKVEELCLFITDKK